MEASVSPAIAKQLRGCLPCALCILPREPVYHLHVPCALVQDRFCWAMSSKHERSCIRYVPYLCLIIAQRGPKELF